MHSTASVTSPRLRAEGSTRKDEHDLIIVEDNEDKRRIDVLVIDSDDDDDDIVISRSSSSSTLPLRKRPRHSSKSTCPELCIDEDDYSDTDDHAVVVYDTPNVVLAGSSRPHAPVSPSTAVLGILPDADPAHVEQTLLRLNSDVQAVIDHMLADGYPKIESPEDRAAREAREAKQEEIDWLNVSTRAHPCEAYNQLA